MTTTTTRSPIDSSSDIERAFPSVLEPLSDPLGFEAGDSNLTRYVGNTAPNATDPFGLQQQLSKQSQDALGFTTDDEKKRKVADVGEIVLTSAARTTAKVRILDITDKDVTFMISGQKVPKTAPIDSFSDNDKEFLKKLDKIPPNITIDASNRREGEREKFIRAVVDEFDTLSKLPKGKEIIDGINEVYDPAPQKLPRKKLPFKPAGNDTTITIIPSGVTTKETGLPNSTIKGTDMNPITGKLNPKSPLEIHFNPASSYPGLGKELWHAWQSTAGAIVPMANKLKWDLDAGPMVSDVLKKQYEDWKKKQIP